MVKFKIVRKHNSIYERKQDSVVIMIIIEILKKVNR